MTTEYRTATASVSGGSGSYYYEWYVQSCYLDYCDEQYLYEEGSGLSSVSVAFYADESTKKVTVQVWDNSNPKFSGSGAQTRIGPSPETSTNFQCQLGNEHYPIHNFNPANPGEYEAYYRDGCTGQRVYDPDHPNLPFG